MELRTAGMRSVAASITATAALAIVAAPAHAEDYVVKPGDTVSEIAAAHGSTTAAIIDANHLDSQARIRAGQHLTIPSTATTPAPPTTLTHRVSSGDTLWALSQRYGVSIAAIVRANGLSDPSLIRIGTSLTIPGGTAPMPATEATVTASPAPSTTHVVSSGDTLSALSRRYGVSVSSIADANKLTNPSLIRIGQVLTIPGAAPSGLVGDTFLGRTYPAAVVAAANVNKATLNASTVPSRTDMQRLVVSTAQQMGVNTALAQAIAYQESGFDQRAVSPANAIGCMQVIPSSGEWASDLVGRNLNLLDANDNVTAGVAILRRLTDRNDLDVAIASYYQGERSVRERGMNPDTVRYVASVRALMERFE